MNKISIALFLTGALILIVSGIVGFVVLPNYVNSRIEAEVALEPLSDTWEKWTNIDRPLYFDVYILNVTNPDDVEQGAYPIFKEIGPYSYLQRRRKRNVSQSAKQIVSYEQDTYYFFDKYRSWGRREEDTVNIINLPFVSVIHGLNQLAPELVDLVANTFLQTESFTRRNVMVGELLFSGFDVSLYTENPILAQFLPEEFDGGRFGVYKGRNGSSDGTYTIHSGVGDASHFGELITWRGKSDFGFWEPLSECDRVVGTDGTIFPPFVDKEKTLHVFSSDVCRSLPFVYKDEETVQDIKGYRFVLPAEALEDPKTNSDNRCFCVNQDIDNCWLAGVIDISVCRNGAPFMLSTPHYLDGSKVLSMDTGLWPDRSLHETSLVIEPSSGVLLKANKRIQVNVNYKKVPVANALVNTRDMVFPVLWIDENVVFTGDNAAELNDQLLTPKKNVEAWRWVGIGIGIAVVLSSVAMYIWKG